MGQPRIIAVRTAVRCRGPNALPRGAMPQQRAAVARTEAYRTAPIRTMNDGDAGTCLSVQWLGVADGSLYPRPTAASPRRARPARPPGPASTRKERRRVTAARSASSIRRSIIPVRAHVVEGSMCTMVTATPGTVSYAAVRMEERLTAPSARRLEQPSVGHLQLSERRHACRKHL